MLGKPKIADEEGVFRPGAITVIAVYEPMVVAKLPHNGRHRVVHALVGHRNNARVWQL